MPTSHPWFRLYGDILSDRKLTRISKIIGQPRALLLGVWTVMLALANESPERGRLLLAPGQPLTLEDLKDETGIDEIETVLGQFVVMDMIAKDSGVWYIVHWKGRQFEGDGPSTSRVQKHRETAKQQANEALEGNVPETFHSNAPETESETESETEQREVRNKPRTPPPPMPPQILAFREAMGGKRVPHKATWPVIVKSVGEDKQSLDRWKAAIIAWIAVGYKPINLTGMLDWYKNGVPQTGARGNGPDRQDRSTSSKPGQPTATADNLPAEMRRLLRGGTAILDQPGDRADTGAAPGPTEDAVERLRAISSQVDDSARPP